MLDRQTFGQRFRMAYADPLYETVADALERLEEVAWQAYITGRKSPCTERAGADFENPDFELSSEWLATRRRVLRAQEKWSCPETPTRVLLVCGAARNDGTCPGEMSKTFRLLSHIRETVMQDGVETDVLDLSLLASEYGRHIHPCKGCVSTAMPLCHWPCSCYPNHGLNQTNDWMAEIYERWTAAHAVVIVTPVYWYQSPSPLKLMIDRLVCADGEIPIPRARPARIRHGPRTWKWPDGTIPSIWRDGYMGCWCMATWPGLKARAARCPTGSTGWG